jgi:hypothetical protein
MSRGVCERFDRRKECVDEVSVYFWVKLNAPGFFLRVSKRKKIKNGGWYVVGLYLEDCLRTYIDKIFFPPHFCWVEFSPEVYRRILNTPCTLGTGFLPADEAVSIYCCPSHTHNTLYLKTWLLFLVSFFLFCLCINCLMILICFNLNDSQILS